MKTLLKLIFGKNGYFFLIFSAHRMLYKKIVAGIIKRSPYNVALFLLSINSVKKIKFGFDKKKQLFFVRENEVKHYFTNAFRGNWLFQKGLFNRGLTLCKSYGIDKISIKPDDIIIDVGANYGDLGIYLRKFGSKLYGFEPDPEPFQALKENNYHKVFNMACSDRKGTSKLYIYSSHADSSLIANNLDKKYIEVETDTLDNLFREKSKIKLIKIEAEGFEPEILKGSLDIIKKTEFICVDGGPERGPKNAQTIEELVNILTDNNFNLLFLNDSGRALFSNNKFNN
tara:strand:+ start:180 stop:1034 length:855 start_codon:yes stop_codon:yes gene_type:complete